MRASLKSTLRHGHKPRAGATPTYEAWRGMFRRCENPRNEKFPSYGGRGIRIWDGWRSFDAFLRDMGECPPEHSLDRRDNDGDYEPGNCRWATRKEQGRNKRNNRLLEHDGEVLPLNAWAERFGISRDVIRQRVDKLGWPVARALTTEVRAKA